MDSKISSEKLYCFGFGWWKYGYLRNFLNGAGYSVIFVKDARSAIRKGFNRHSNIVVWGHNEMEDVQNLSSETGIGIWRVEDGFIRSVGLGSELVPPMSLVLDRKGIYYDPTTESDLESILNNYSFTQDIITRAKRLRELIVQGRVTKYNCETYLSINLRVKSSQKVIFVPGQVENDISIRLGSPVIKTNKELLMKVRDINPDAFIIYKPHPDVLAKNRKGHIERNITEEFCDHIETNASVINCIEAADEIHTMTSLTGFDALLRDKKVIVYGVPFYAGWGLTNDYMQIPRRKRKLTVDELVAGALILYPMYWDDRKKMFTEPEIVLNRIIEKMNRKSNLLLRSSTLQKAKNLIFAIKNIIKWF